MFKNLFRTSLEVQWLKILLTMLGTSVQSLVQVDCTRCRATKPVCHNKRSHCNERRHAATRDSLSAATKAQHNHKANKRKEGMLKKKKN